MAVSIGSTSERWLQGLDRLVAGAFDLLPQMSLPSRAGAVPARWVMERGPARAAATVNALGGFPGALRSMNRIRSASLIVTGEYLVVGEGTPEGFALPMQTILAAGVVRHSSRSNPGVVVHFQDGPTVGAFALEIRGTARGRSGRLRAREIVDALQEHGVSQLARHEVPVSPGLGISWDEARERADEPLVWSGMANGSTGGWFGGVHSGCRMWLTTESLFWSCANGEGVNRLPLADVLEMRDGVGDRVMVSLRNAAGHRFDFAFELAAEPGKDGRRQRLSYLNAIASLGVPVSAVRSPLAPWRRGGMVRPTER